MPNLESEQLHWPTHAWWLMGKCHKKESHNPDKFSAIPSFLGGLSRAMDFPEELGMDTYYTFLYSSLETTAAETTDFESVISCSISGNDSSSTEAGS